MGVVRSARARKVWGLGPVAVLEGGANRTFFRGPAPFGGLALLTDALLFFKVMFFLKVCVVVWSFMWCFLSRGCIFSHSISNFSPSRRTQPWWVLLRTLFSLCGFYGSAWRPRKCKMSEAPQYLKPPLVACTAQKLFTFFTRPPI